MTEEIRAILQEHGRLSADVATLADDADLYAAGLTSLASVSLMLALEAKFDLEFPERMLRRKTFESMASIAAAIRELTGEEAAA
jgi:acyl carrier protein